MDRIDYGYVSFYSEWKMAPGGWVRAKIGPAKLSMLVQKCNQCINGLYYITGTLHPEEEAPNVTGPFVRQDESSPVS